jgi:hypothetical protein
MKEKTMNSKTNSTIILAQALLWAWIVLMPGAISLFTGDNPQDVIKISYYSETRSPSSNHLHLELQFANT